MYGATPATQLELGPYIMRSQLFYVLLAGNKIQGPNFYGIYNVYGRLVCLEIIRVWCFEMFGEATILKKYPCKNKFPMFWRKKKFLRKYIF